MKIGLDYIAVVGNGGNSTYSKNLFKVILSSQKNEYYLYCFVHDFFRGKFNNYKNINNIHIRPVYFSNMGLPIPFYLINIVNKISFLTWTLIDRLDIFHFTNPLNHQYGFQKNTVVTIHDLSGLRSGGWSKESSIIFFKNKIENIIKKSSAIIAVSEYTKKDIVDTFPEVSSRVFVTLEASDEDYYADIDVDYIKEKFSLEKYILYVGQIQPRKNILNLLMAYALLSDEIKNKYPLVLVGSIRDAEYSKRVKSIIEENNIGSHVKILGRLDNASIRKLYSSARLFVFPSMFEGFGLPVVESIVCGTPVLTSNTTSLPEVAGEAGVLVDPNSILDIYNNLNKVLVDDAFYGNLKNNCFSQAGKFSWEITGKQTLDIYNSIN